MEERIHGYQLNMPFQNKNAGFSGWTYAQKNGKAYFVKRLLDPKYPIDNRVMHPELMEKRKALCRKFEEKQARLFEIVAAVSDGNLVRVEEFFRQDSTYYITMPRVQGMMENEEFLLMDCSEKLIVCLALAHSILCLHRAGIVHTDIKETNVLLKKTIDGGCTAKLIDLDSCLFESELSNSDVNIVGDQVYMAPEVCLHVLGQNVSLNRKIDVFSLGILFHKYLTGTLPDFNKEEYHYVHEAILDGQTVMPALPPALSIEWHNLIEAMLRREPDERCDMEYVFQYLQKMAAQDGEVPAEAAEKVPKRSSPVFPRQSERHKTKKTFERAQDL